jgi:hypothetical protein
MRQSNLRRLAWAARKDEGTVLAHIAERTHQGLQISIVAFVALAGATLAVAASAATAAPAPAAGAPEPAPFAAHVHYIPARGVAVNSSPDDLIYNGGPVIPSARVVFIFWGPSFNDTTSPDHAYAQTLRAFRDQFGMAPEYNVITQYYQNPGTQHIQLTNLGSGTPDWFDTSAPPVNVTDAAVQTEVIAYLGSHTFDTSTIYEVVTPSGSYSTSGGDSSCGGPNLVYCAYHSYFISGANAVKYSIQPYPSCGGCQVGGWSPAQDQEHFVCHETREAVTDQQIDAWLDSSGNEADDKCAWSPSPFIGTGGYSYQYEWSNAVSGCVQSVSTGSNPVPAVTTGAASGVTQATATLAGTVNPNGFDAKAHFNFGQTSSYGSSTAIQDVGAGTAGVPVSANLTGLYCGTTYHFQAAGVNSGGSGYGADQTFTTGACPHGFFTATPCRLIDTRPNPLSASTTYEISITGFCGIPPSAKAISANITAVGPTTAGFLTLWPAQTTLPATANISVTAGQVLANNAVLALAPGFFGNPGAVWIIYGGSGTVDVIIDINGYFQ